MSVHSIPRVTALPTADFATAFEQDTAKKSSHKPCVFFLSQSDKKQLHNLCTLIFQRCQITQNKKNSRSRKGTAVWLCIKIERLFINLCFFPHLCKALAAVNGAILTGSEGYLAFCTALCAGSVEHFTLGLVCVLACITAGLAALRLIFKALCSVELLLAGCENEFVAAFLTDESLVFVHFGYLAKTISIFSPGTDLHRSFFFVGHITDLCANRTFGVQLAAYAL